MLKKLINKILRKPSSEISFRQGFDLTSLPIVTFYQGKNKFNFVLDTGSTGSVIDSNILHSIKHSKVPIKTTIFGMEGNTKDADICTIKMSYRDNTFTYDYIISDLKQAFNQVKKESGVTLHGIIGSRFFNDFKYVLDFDELIAYSKK